MPLSSTPCVRGSTPVRIDDRDGWQTRLGVMHAEKRVPLCAIASRCGVFTRRALEAVAVRALLVGRDEKDVRSLHDVYSGLTPAALTTAGQRLISARTI